MSLAWKLVHGIHCVATGPARLRRILTPVAPVVFFGIVTLVVAASLWVDRKLGLPRFPGPRAGFVISLPLLAGGCFLSGWSVLSFLRSRGTPIPFNPPPELVVTGPYAHTRNPMLSGLFLLLFGLGSYLGSLSMVFLFTPGFIGLMVWELKAVEEPELEMRLGQRYADYRRSVPMFLPRISP